MNDELEVTETDVEDGEPEEIIPYKYSITSYGADYPVDGLIKRLGDNVILVPQFQRGYVWTLTKASRFIESLLLGLPVPGIFLSRESGSGRLLVIDGQQRLRTLHMFFEGIFSGREFRLTSVQDTFEGKTYKTLDEEDRIQLDDSIIHATIVKQDEPTDDQSSVFHIFERLNTGGMQLQPQEIRSCIYHGSFTELLRELNEYGSWRNIYGPHSKRLKDHELILRFFALSYWADKYERPIKEFLSRYMAANKDLDLQDSGTLKAKFVNVVDLISDEIGTRAFRPERALNAAVYDAVMVGLSNRLAIKPIVNFDAIVAQYDNLLKRKDFSDATRTGTSDVANVETRIRLANEAFEKVE